MGLQNFYGKVPHPLLRAGSWAAHGKLTISDIPKCLNYCTIFIVYTQLRNGPHVVHMPQVGDS